MSDDDIGWTMNFTEIITNLRVNVVGQDEREREKTTTQIKIIWITRVNIRCMKMYQSLYQNMHLCNFSTPSILGTKPDIRSNACSGKFGLKSKTYARTTAKLPPNWLHSILFDEENTKRLWGVFFIITIAASNRVYWQSICIDLLATDVIFENLFKK